MPLSENSVKDSIQLKLAELNKEKIHSQQAKLQEAELALDNLARENARLKLENSHLKNSTTLNLSEKMLEDKVEILDEPSEENKLVVPVVSTQTTVSISIIEHKEVKEEPLDDRSAIIPDVTEPDQAENTLEAETEKLANEASEATARPDSIMSDDISVKNTPTPPVNQEPTDDTNANQSDTIVQTTESLKKMVEENTEKSVKMIRSLIDQIDPNVAEAKKFLSDKLGKFFKK
jgi:hypothetical protein